MKRLSVSDIKAMKSDKRIVCLTAYDYSTAKIVDESGIHLILVGDSLGMTMLGYESTLPVTMEEMIHHTKAVVRGVDNAVVVGDMPFMSYQVSVEDGVRNAGRFIKEAGADAVKIEGGQCRTSLVEALVENGIPVLGHIGLTPQSIKAIGGYKVQGKNHDQFERLLADAQSLAEAGVFGIVLECVPGNLAERITEAIAVPTIGIGAGASCDGQILVTHDLIGTFADFKPRFVKRYADVGAQMRKAFTDYIEEVQSGAFPADEHSY